MKRKTLLCSFALAVLTVSTKSQDMSNARVANHAVRYVGGSSAQSDLDIGAQINSAYVSLPPEGGTVIVIGRLNGGCYDFVTPIVAAVPGKDLLLEGGDLPSPVSQPLSPPCLNYEPTDASSAITLDYVVAGPSVRPFMHGIRDLTLTNNSCRTRGGCGSEASGITIGGTNGGADGATFDNLQVVGFGKGVNVATSRLDSGEISFRTCTLVYNATGFADTHGDAVHISFDACHFHANGTGVVSRASITISDSILTSNIRVSVHCSHPAACNLNNDHFDSGDTTSTHFLAGNGVFSILGGDMRDSGTSGTTDWWMHFAGSNFSILGTSLTTRGRSPQHVILSDSPGNALVQSANQDLLSKLYSSQQPVASTSPSSAGLPNGNTQTTNTEISGKSGILTRDPADLRAQRTFELPSQVAIKLSTTDSVRYVSPSGSNSNDGLSPGSAMATINAADAAIGSGTNNNGAIVLTGAVTNNTTQIRLGPRHALIIYGLLQISQPILLADGATVDCIVPRGSGGATINEGGIVAVQNMPQMIRGLTQDGMTEMFTVRNCGLDGGYNTFTGPGLIDTTGMNDRTTIENNEIIHFSGSACIGAQNAPSNSTSFQFWLNNWCNATGKNAACGQLLVTENNSGSLNNIDIENLECAGWNSKYAFLIRNSGSAPSNAINNITVRGLKGLYGEEASSLVRIDRAWQVTVDNPHLFNGTQNVVDVSNDSGNIGIVLMNVEDNARSGCYIDDHLNHNCVTNANGGHVVLPFYAVWNRTSPDAVIGCASIVCGAYSGPAPAISPGTSFNSGSLGLGNGSKTFTVKIGSGDSDGKGTLSFPAASHGWLCSAADLTSPATNLPRQSGGSPTTADFTNFNAQGTQQDWISGDTLQFQCEPY